jgi:dolichol-phosphate mannosyltransferase
MKPLVTVVVPFYNEEQAVPAMGEQVDAVFADLPGYLHECIYVNDGSTDGTHAALEALRTRGDHIHPVHLVENCGQSAALVTGMRRAQGDFVLMFDGDLQNDPADIPKMLALLQDYDCAFGYRGRRQDSSFKKLSSAIGNGMRQFMLRDGIRDAGCGSKGFRRVCMAHIISFNGMHRYFGVIMRAAGMRIVEFEATHHPRRHGTSKYGVHNRLWRGIYDLLGVAWLNKRYVAPQVEEER